MNYYKQPTAIQESANAEAMTVFAEHMNQFKGICHALRDIEGNLAAIGQAALHSSSRAIQTDDGTTG